jgi:hypothetical protein
MSLCDICQKIDIRGLLLSYLREVKDKDLGPLWDNNIMLREPLFFSQALQASRQHPWMQGKYGELRNV